MRPDLVNLLRRMDAVLLANHHNPYQIIDESKKNEQRRKFERRLSSIWDEMARCGSEATEYVSLRRGERPDWKRLSELAGKLGTATRLLSLFVLDDEVLVFSLAGTEEVPRIRQYAFESDQWQSIGNRIIQAAEKRVWRSEAALADLPPQMRSGTAAGAPLNILTREFFQEDSEQSNESFEAFCKSEIVPLLHRLLPELQDAERVVLSPQSVFHLLPWPALALLAGWTAKVAVTPSLDLLARLRQRPAQPHWRGALVIGNPIRDELRRLPQAENEARQIARLLEVEPLLGTAATKQAVLSQLDGVELTHLATHASFDPADPLNSGIELYDGVLTAREILERGYRLPEFVDLSACQTGVMSSLGGEELAGLNMALFYAGAKSLLVSLWKVDDPATAYLMQQFYEGWKLQKQDKPAALYNAMQATRQAQPDWADLYYWGGFTLIGDWQ